MPTLINSRGKIARPYFACLLLLTLMACGTTQPSSTTARPQRIRMEVGTVREITLPAPADTTRVLSASSDNSEVVDVSPKPDVAGTGAVGSSGPFVFLVKGVTIGTARVLFTEKKAGDAGNGQVRRIYLVQVVSK